MDRKKLFTLYYAVLLAGAGCRAASSMALEANAAKDNQFVVPGYESFGLWVWSVQGGTEPFGLRADWVWDLFC